MITEISLKKISGVYLLAGIKHDVPQVLRKMGPEQNPKRAFYIGQSCNVWYRASTHLQSPNGHKLKNFRMFLLRQTRKNIHELEKAERRFIAAARELGLHLTNTNLSPETFPHLQPEIAILKEVCSNFLATPTITKV